jgi:hypothetical protein
MPEQTQNTPEQLKQPTPEKVPGSQEAGAVERAAEQGPLANSEIAPERGKENRLESEEIYKRILQGVKKSGARDTDDDDDEADSASDNDLRRIQLEEDRERQVALLVNLTVQKGVPYAVDVARKIDNYYVIDALRNRLVSEEFYFALVDAGVIPRFKD